MDLAVLRPRCALEFKVADYPVKYREDVLPSANSFPKKSIGKDWGAETEAANAPNTPSMETAKHDASINWISDYNDEDADSQNVARTTW